jgi:hypothetical protein
MCAGNFNPEESQGMRAFINSHLDACDVMSLVVRRQMAVEPVTPS